MAQWFCATHPCFKPAIDEPEHHKWLRHTKKHHVYVCAWCVHQDVIGTDFGKHVREVHGFDFDLAKRTREFIAELKTPVYKLYQCFKCKVRSADSDELAEHALTCTGSIKATKRVYVGPHNVDDFFDQHKMAMAQMRGRRILKRNPTATYRIWVSRTEAEGEQILTIEPTTTREEKIPTEQLAGAIASVEDDRATATADKRMSFERERVGHRYAMFGDIQTRIWGSSTVNRRRMYLEVPARPGVYDVVVNFDKTIRMTVGEVAGFQRGSEALETEERRDAATDEFEAMMLVAHSPPVMGAMVSFDDLPPIGEYVFQRRGDPSEVHRVTVNDRWCMV